MHSAAGRRSRLACALAALGLLAQRTTGPGASFAPAPRGPAERTRGPAAGRGHTGAAAGALSAVAAQDAEEARAADEVYELWVDQFPIAAARRDFYGLPCGRADVKARFASTARAVGVSAAEALEIFGPDLWVLCIPEEKLLERMEALRAVVASEEELIDFVRFAPRALGTTSSAEIRERGVENMKARAAVGAAYEALVSPIRLLFKAMARNTASSIDCETASLDDACSVDDLKAAEERAQQGRLTVGGIVLGTTMTILLYCLYADAVYGGPIHGKGICPASPIPTYNIPDAEGNSRLPCNCAPIWKWYIEPRLAPDQRGRFQPKVESKNCGRELGGAKRACDPRTVGGCIWTAEDLAKDPSTWDRRERTYWERQREGRGA